MIASVTIMLLPVYTPVVIDRVINLFNAVQM